MPVRVRAILALGGMALLLMLVVAGCSRSNAGPVPTSSLPLSVETSTPGSIMAPTAMSPAVQAQPTLPVPTPLPTAQPTEAVAQVSQATLTSQVLPVTPTAPATQVVADSAAPVCTPGTLTPSQTEGPYYKANPPDRSSLLDPGMPGTKLTLTGYVLSADCRPIPGARVDFWQADAAGAYDNTGYRLRGYQLTDEQGRYTLETVIPGLYPGRTRHIHIKVQAPNGPVLTTQLYFAGEAANRTDSIFNPQLVLNLQDGKDGKTAQFNFVVATQ